MEAWHEPVDVRERVQELIEQSVVTALSKLSAAVRGQDDFANEREFSACVAMSRLAPFVMQELPPRETIWDKVHPDNTPEEAIRLMREMGYPEDVIRDGCPIDSDTVPREETESEQVD
jgi:transcriptional regulator of met regulon